MVLKEFSVNFLADVLVLSNGSEGYKDNCLGGVGFHFYFMPIRNHTWPKEN